MLVTQSLNPVTVGSLRTAGRAAGHACLKAGFFGCVNSSQHLIGRVTDVETKTAELFLNLINAAVPAQGDEVFN
jgi:hypothetical protein